MTAFLYAGNPTERLSQPSFTCTQSRILGCRYFPILTCLRISMLRTVSAINTEKIQNVHTGLVRLSCACECLQLPSKFWVILIPSHLLWICSRKHEFKRELHTRVLLSLWPTLPSFHFSKGQVVQHEIVSQNCVEQTRWWQDKSKFARSSLGSQAFAGLVKPESYENRLMQCSRFSYCPDCTQSCYSDKENTKHIFPVESTQ